MGFPTYKHMQREGERVCTHSFPLIFIINLHFTLFIFVVFIYFYFLSSLNLSQIYMNIQFLLLFSRSFCGLTHGNVESISLNKHFLCHCCRFIPELVRSLSFARSAHVWFWFLFACSRYCYCHFGNVREWKREKLAMSVAFCDKNRNHGPTKGGCAAQCDSEERGQIAKMFFFLLFDLDLDFNSI